jgi:hypothetical protein
VKKVKERASRKKRKGGIRLALETREEGRRVDRLGFGEEVERFRSSQQLFSRRLQIVVQLIQLAVQRRQLTEQTA